MTDVLDDIDNIIDSIGEKKKESTSEQASTDDLDDILGELTSDPNVKVSTTVEVSSDGTLDDLDSLVAGLETDDAEALDLGEAVTSQTSKESTTVQVDSTDLICHICSKKIEGKASKDGGKVYHTECFKCTVCNEPLTGKFFDDKKRGAHCGKCYAEAFQCGECKKTIEGSYLTREGTRYHSACLPERICVGCQKEVKGTVLTAFDASWHPSCFVCQDCSKEVTKYFNVGGKPVCDECNKIRNPPVLCSVCQEPLSGEFLSINNEKMHRNCFKCHKCDASLASGSYFEVDGKPACEACLNQ